MLTEFEFANHFSAVFPEPSVCNSVDEWVDDVVNV